MEQESDDSEKRKPDDPAGVFTPDIRRTAARCRHYAMCKIDFLGTGICPPAEVMPYVAYFPQGRMDICAALAKGELQVTKALVDIISTCTLCGRCDRQCHFVTGLRPMKVMSSLKAFLARYRRNGGKIIRTRGDETLDALKRIVGAKWASNDPAIRIAYSDDPFPLAGPKMPQYVVLPGNQAELVKVIKFADESQIPCVVRGNGGSVFGFVFTEGIVIDVNRMKEIRIDPENWTARIGPGVTSFELQSAASANGFRVNAAEPAATVCGNIVCTGMFSTWANAYGVGADHFVEMTFADRQGTVFRSSDKTAPNIFGFENAVTPSPGTCIEAKVRLFPMTDDEEGVLVPFSSFEEAVAFSRDLSVRRIGLSIGILGGHYLSTFMSPTASLAEKIRNPFADTLGIAYGVCVVGDAYARQAINRMAPCVIDSRLFKTLMLGLPNLAEPEWDELVQGLESDRPAYETVFSPEMQPVLEALLDPSAETIAAAVDEDLRKFYTELYRQPNMTDMVWLNMYRIVSSRMSRHKHMFAFLVYVPLDRTDVIYRLMEEFRKIAEKNRIDHDFGFLTPIDFGKRAILEYDYYIDHTDPGDSERIKAAMQEIEPWMDEMSSEFTGVKWLKYVFSQGCARKECFLYS